jgi:hypothetical protein
MIDNIACVVTYFDEEHEVPADYVLKWSNDYEAFVAKVTGDTLDAISIGHFPSVGLAVQAIHQWNELDKLRTADGSLDFNLPLAN